MKECIVLLAGLALMSSSCDEQKAEEIVKKNPEAKERVDIGLNKSQTVINEASVKFSMRFMKQTLKTEGNVFLSPLSAQMALTMALNGANGETYDEMQKALGYEGLENEDLNAYNKLMIESLCNVDNTTTVEIANSLWGNKDFSFKDEYVKTNKDAFDAEVRNLDFGSAGAPGVINGWCGEKTHGLIDKVVDGNIRDMEAMLINALYFKGMWATPFEKSGTRDRDFTNVDGTKTKVKMMSAYDSYGYIENENVKMVELPYGNGAFSMVVALPGEETTMDECVDYIADNWSNLNGRRMWNKKVDLWLPKFEMKYRRSLTKDLVDMGMKAPFDAMKADFSKMSDVDLKISSVEQLAYIKVDEEGTEAAAVTTIGYTTTSLNPEPMVVEFHVDRPFIYAIKELSTGAVLFMGKMESMKE